MNEQGSEVDKEVQIAISLAEIVKSTQQMCCQISIYGLSDLWLVDTVLFVASILIFIGGFMLLK